MSVGLLLCALGLQGCLLLVCLHTSKLHRMFHGVPACMPAYTCYMRCKLTAHSWEPRRPTPAGASVRDHLLTSYQKAVVAVVAAQFGQKSLYRGREGVLDLAQQKGGWVGGLRGPCGGGKEGLDKIASDSKAWWMCVEGRQCLVMLIL